MIRNSIVYKDLLTRELLTVLVERMEAHESGDIVIRFCDEYRRPVLREEHEI